MNYEEKYKEALERARGLYDFYKDNPAQAQKFIDIFPELAENKDERIRKEMLAFCERASSGQITIMVDKDTEDFKSWIAWLKKHKEQTPAEWNEEDDIMKQNCHQMLALLRPNSSELIKDTIDNCHHWLKSLKERIKGE